jgi:hypothetical protein
VASGKRTRLPASTDQASQLAAELHLHQHRSDFCEPEDELPPARPVLAQPRVQVQPERASEHEVDVSAPAVAPEQPGLSVQAPRQAHARKAVTPPISAAGSDMTHGAVSWTAQASTGVVSGKPMNRKQD